MENSAWWAQQIKMSFSRKTADPPDQAATVRRMSARSPMSKERNASFTGRVHVVGSERLGHPRRHVG